MQKLIRVVDDSTEYLDSLLKVGWEVKQMTCCQCKRTLNDSLCYVLLEMK